VSPEALVVTAMHVPLVCWLFSDRFREANGWADQLERLFPPWFRWDTMGDPVSWVQHGLIALVVSLWAGFWAWGLTPEGFYAGAAFGGWCAFAAYVVREGWNALDNLMRPNVWTHPAPHRVGWAVDGLMDVVGPLVNALLWTLL